MNTKRWLAIALSIIMVASVNVTLARPSGTPEEDSMTADDRLADPSPRVKAFREAFASLPDPGIWSEEASSGLHYRRATSEELTSNEWKPGTFLVESGSLARLSDGPETATMLVPLTDGSAIPVPVERVSTETDSRHAVSHAGPEEESKTPPRVSSTTFYDYEEDLERLETERVSASLKADDDGGYYGEVTTSGITATFESNEDWWHVDKIPTEDGESVEPSSLTLVTLSPRQPADSSLLASAPSEEGPSTMSQTNYDFALMGEIKWCTRYESSWKTKIDTLGDDVNQGFGNTDANLGMKHDHCWIADSLSEAEDCANNGGCSDSDGHAYPYNGFGDDAEEYRDHVWDDVDHSRLHWSFEPLKIAQAIHDGSTERDAGYRVCGTSQGYPGSGGSVAAGLPLPDGCDSYVSTHEIGHNFDASHDNNLNANGCTTVMGESSAASCRENYFSSSSASEVNNCVTLSDCPRSGTG